MAQDKISVREWQRKFQAGDFHQDDLDISEQAGWEDFYDPLNNKGLKNLSKLVMSITHPFILDNYHVYFLQHTPNTGPMYGCVYFAPLSKDRSKKGFDVSLDSPHERQKWALMTRRYGDGAPEFESGNIRSMSRYINNMAHELKQDIQPAFIVEKRAVELYAICHGEPVGIYIYREGEHNFSYTSFQNQRKRFVVAVSSLDEAPSGFVLEQAEQMEGIYVYCPDDSDKAQFGSAV